MPAQSARSRVGPACLWFLPCRLFFYHKYSTDNPKIDFFYAKCSRQKSKIDFCFIKVDSKSVTAFEKKALGGPRLLRFGQDVQGFVLLLSRHSRAIVCVAELASRDGQS